MKRLPMYLLGVLAASPALADSYFGATTGIDYSTGKYGNAASSDILYVPVTGKYVSDDLTLKLTVPYISVTGPGGVILGMGRTGMGMASSGGAGGMGGGGMMSGGGSSTTTTRTTNSGLGDITAAAGYTVYSAEQLNIDLVGGIKFGTADSNKGLGTGRNDYSVQLDGYRSMDKVMFYATLGYKFISSPPGVKFNNVPFGTLGASRKLDDGLSIGAMLDIAKSASQFSANRRELTAYASRQVSSDTTLTLNVLKGFSDGSPDSGISLFVSHVY